MRSKIISILSFLGFVLLGVVIFVFIHNARANNPANRTVSAIPVGSKFAVATEHSKGVRPICLASDKTATAAVRKDDSFIDKNPAWSAFDMSTTSGIIDVPAGTNVDNFIHSYDGKIVQASIRYSGKYGTYNITVAHTSEASPNQWHLKSMIACANN